MRAALLLSALLQAIAGFVLLRLRHGGKLATADRAAWGHRSSRMILRRMGMELRVEGGAPAGGLIVANHLSYFDILMFSAAVPCVFVAKSEVRRWPLFGFMAELAGTIFIERGRAASAAMVAEQMAARLCEGVCVVLFPEGTSSDGSALGRFHTWLFEPAVECGSAVTAAAIGYAAAGQAESDLCYYGDISFAPHLLQALGYRNVGATVRFADEAAVYPDRRSAANTTHTQIMTMRNKQRG